MSFTDYYEILEVSPNANSETIERVFRYLAGRYHPDNQATGDRDKFDDVLEAYETLRDTVKRVRYDAEYKRHAKSVSELAGEAETFDGVDEDTEMQARLLSLFYLKRRRDSQEPGIGDAELSMLLDCPPERLDFHLWYLKEKKWIARREDGTLAITVDGVDRASAEQDESESRKLLADRRKARG